MGRGPARKPSRSGLPETLRDLFWDYDFRVLTWEEDRHLIVARILSAGGWNAVSWLRRRVGDDGIRDWIRERRGDGLDERRLRFWELILGLPKAEVTAWIQEPGRQIWRDRVKR